MSNTAPSPHDWLPDKVRNALARIEPYLHASTQAYSDAWDRIFTESEREQMGGNIFAYSQQMHFDLIQIYGHLRGVSQYRAIIELARDLDQFTPAKAAWLLREVGEEQDDEVAEQEELRVVPHWDRLTHRLTLDGEVIKIVSRPNVAKNVIRVLDAFEAQGWPLGIDDPLPGGRDQQRLHATIASLNERLTCIKFNADGTGAGFEWRRI